MSTHAQLTQLEVSIPSCTKCPELRAYCAQVAKEKRKAFADWDYWGRPVPGFGDPEAAILIVGLAPAAHGANRTGRMFTGDRSGDFLYAALHRAGFASQPQSTHCGDGLTLREVFISAPLRCAPPGNKPTATQLDRCRPYLVEEMNLLTPRVVLCLGGIAWKTALRVLTESGRTIPRPQPKFSHGADAVIGDIHLLGSYHVSQQNTFTGRLTPAMFDEVLARARSLISS